jgi:hypothetical protein
MFSYSNVPSAGFPVGLGRVELEDGRAFLIATPEKALTDKLREGRGLGLSTQKECLSYLLEDLRIDEAALRGLDAGLLDELARHYRSQRGALLARLVRRLARGRE